MESYLLWIQEKIVNVMYVDKSRIDCKYFRFSYDVRTLNTMISFHLRLNYSHFHLLIMSTGTYDVPFQLNHMQCRIY